MTMDETPAVALSGVVLDSPDARELAGFHRRLLGPASHPFCLFLPG